jgi:hypothetical protein
MIASVSIAAQAMLIFRRSTRSSAVVLEQAVPEPVIRPKPQTEDTTNTSVPSYSESKDMEVTDHSFVESDQTLVPQEVVEKFKQEEASAKKTITLMSRENADKIAVDRYRTAAVEGEPLSVLIIEVDGLSKLREKDGDQVAYKVFAAIVKYIFTRVDKNKDILGRYGQNGALQNCVWRKERHFEYWRGCNYRRYRRLCLDDQACRYGIIRGQEKWS